uniref:Uncharacterized protein n=1 Tax=Chromera velia CCMP2878 TaxID=1169474 RepID=A0A0G4HD22_9ALVE|eukprot:Cvel_26231.t1-p1 / transcript=Cvel_26231.t1 / gene=Cvel_26231 / organism=Chromera_velia_CCMP2878 / gene_product=hypothetical protein / transcript_product=hypothetical protein / location=Cvel_scaffold3092:10562-10948(-) / protein_length=129 / sequence_SO=supercontig / SO=protein_coding / is_pseudo=false
MSSPPVTYFLDAPRHPSRSRSLTSRLSTWLPAEASTMPQSGGTAQVCSEGTALSGQTPDAFRGECNSELTTGGSGCPSVTGASEDPTPDFLLPPLRSYDSLVTTLIAGLAMGTAIGGYRTERESPPGLP